MSITAAIILGILCIFLSYVLIVLSLETDEPIGIAFVVVLVSIYCIVVFSVPSSSYPTKFETQEVSKTMIDFDDNLIMETTEGLRISISERKYSDLEKSKVLVVERDFKNVLGNACKNPTVDIDKSLELFKNKQIKIENFELKYPND